MSSFVMIKIPFLSGQVSEQDQGMKIRNQVIQQSRSMNDIFQYLVCGLGAKGKNNICPRVQGEK